jgi:regulatory protein
MNDKQAIKQALNLATNYLAYQPRTIYEMEKYLDKKGFTRDIIKNIVNILLDRNYLNDKEFARLFIKSRIKNKPKSRFALYYELKQKGVNSVDIDAILQPYNDQDLALKSVRPKIKAWQNLDNEKFKKKMANFLQYRGFNYDICQSTLNHFLESRESVEKDDYEN